MADTDDSLLREVNEDLKREQFAKFWDTYGVYLLALAVLIVGGVLGYQYWQKSKIDTAHEYGAKYQAALQLTGDGKNVEADQAFTDIVATGPKGYVVLARLKLAGAAAKAGKNAEAIKIYEAITNDGGADEVLAGYARLQAASLRSGEADWTEMKNRLNNLASGDGAWKYSARELLGISAQRTGNMSEARKYYEMLLSDQQVPRGIKTRVTIMMSMLTQAKLAQSDGKESDGKEKAKMSSPNAAGQKSAGENSVGQNSAGKSNEGKTPAKPASSQ